MKSSFFLFTIIALLALTATSEKCRFAPDYTQAQLALNVTAREEYLEQVMHWEGKFMQDGVGFNLAAGITYDGHPLNFTTGELYDTPHLFTASSKECIQVALLAHIINQNPLAQLLISKDPAEARETAVKILTNKITSYEKFNKTYPGFGGHIPWVSVNGTGMWLLKGWENRVPGLDNGELIWSMVAVIEALKLQNLTDLATRYQNYLDLMTSTAAMIFYAGNGRIRDVTKIKDIYAAPYPENYGDDGKGDLNDPYEGELFAFWLVEFGGLKQADIDMIWENHLPNIVSVEYKTPLGPITVERGWEYSSHEKWKFLMMPYQDVDLMKRLYANGEKVRTWDSYLNNIPGMFAAINDVSTNETIPGYIGCGIPAVAIAKNTRRDVITGYGIYPLFLIESQKINALLWFDNYLKGPKMQNQFGATEAVSINGTMISSLTTWDSKMTTVLGMLGGVVDLNRKFMQESGVYDNFVATVQSLWSQKFSTLKGEEIPFMPPKNRIPTDKLADFTTCSSSSSKIIL